ncbi:MAG: alanine racemase [Solirubrobacteraceae bacterium]
MSTRRALARVNLAAIERNCARLRAELDDGCQLCVVVKANGYGHGAVPSARAALAGGATRLAVAGAREAVELREAGFLDVPVLVMGALSPVELGEALRARAEVVIWREQDVEEVASAGGGKVHVKLDSGMGRLGTRDSRQASKVVAAAAGTRNVELAGVMTHFATADDLDDPFFVEQLDVFTAWAEEVQAVHPHILVHAANSAAALRERRAHFDMVRCGIAAYGMDPYGLDPDPARLEPALELASYIAEVKACAVGQSAGYGRRFVADRDTMLAVLPIGYGDGWRRALSDNADVLIAGRRQPIVGTVSMDNLTVDLDGAVDPIGLRGKEAVLIGAHGGQRITAEELARRMGTINYEVTCGLTARVPRVYHRDGEPVSEPIQGMASSSVKEAVRMGEDSTPSSSR